MAVDFYLNLFEDVVFVILGVSIPFIIRKIKIGLKGTSVEYKLSHTIKLKRIEIISILIWLTGCVVGLFNFFPFDILFYLIGYAVFMINFSLKNETIKRPEAVLISVFSFLTTFLSFLSAVIFIHFTA